MKGIFFAIALFALALAQNCKTKGCTNSYCCSYWGYCGTTTDYCGTGTYQCACDCKGSKPCLASSSTTTTTTTSCETRWTTDALNVRTGPGTNYSAVKVLAKGASVCFVEKTASGWCKLNDGYYVSATYLTATNPNTSTTTSSSSTVTTGGVAQNSFATTGKEGMIRTSGCYFLCYCKLGGLTTKTQVLAAYDACLSKGYIRDTCFINSHYNMKSYFNLSSVNFVHVTSNTPDGHWLVKVSNTQYWDPWEAKTYDASVYASKLLGFASY